MGFKKLATLLPDIVKGFRQTRAAFVVFALGVAISFVAWRFAEERVNSEAVGKFRQSAAQATETVDRRIQDNVNLLIGLKGLFSASDRVTREEFQLYLAGFRLGQRSPWVRVVSYSPRVAQAGKAAFEQRVRGDTSINPRGYPDFAIKPAGERSEYVVAEYLEPMAGNEAALGLDLAADPMRRADIARARDSGEPVASSAFAAAVDPNQLSFAVRMAVYRTGMPTRTLAQRREAFQGMVAVVIHINQLMGSLLGTQLGSELDLSIHDVGPSSVNLLEAPSQQNLLFDSRGPFGAELERANQGPKQVAMLDVAGRKWRLSFSSPSGAYGVERALPKVMFLGGVITSLLLFWLIWTLSLSRARLLKLAEQATVVRTAESLREQLRFIQELIEAIPQPIFFKASDGRYLGVNKAWEKFFGISRAQFLGRSVFELYPDNPELARKHHAMDQELFQQQGSQVYEAAITAADGRVHHTIYNKATFTKTDGSVAGLIGTITDVTALKETEAALRESEARFRDLTELSSDWYWEQNADFRFTHVGRKIYTQGNLDPEADIGKARWEITAIGITEEQWQAHKAQLEAHLPFQDLVYQRYDVNGELRTISVSGRPIADETGRFQGYRGIGKDITEQRRAEERIRHMAHHDTLTGLPNRALLQDRIGQVIALARRNKKIFALLFIDLDRFKNINDSLGHQIGDDLLRSVAGRLTQCMRDTDTVARIGGDEFVAVLPDLGEANDAGNVAQKVLETLSQPFMVEGHELHLTPSIGICAYPHDGSDVESLMKNADAAMYHAKEMGRNNYQFFTQEMNTAAHRRLALENDLRHALEREEFVLHYQPQLDLQSGDIVGLEALIRWRHPQRGLILPDEFIPVAEDTGLIIDIGEWSLRQACLQAMQWQRAGYPLLQVAVNFSPRQFRREGVVEAVSRILRETGLSPACLELEITESTILEHAEQVIVTLKGLSSIGVQLSIDDFGTGYSSLSYLKRFPIDKLKIDQSFVHDVSSDPDDAAIVTAIIAMARSLSLTVIAEGVETADQLAFLKALGCNRAQGYYFSKPLPATEFAHLLRGWHAAPRVLGASG